jgi:integrase
VSRRAKGPRLWLRPARPDGTDASWIILDGTRQRGTGCGESDIAGAEKALSDYLNDKHIRGISAGPRDPAAIPVVDVLTLYTIDRAGTHSDPKKTDSRIGFLEAYWTGKTLADVTGPECRAYARQRGSDAAARRELEDLRSAINHHRREGLHDRIVSVVLPPRSLPRERWLTRKEAAHLILTTWRHQVTGGQGAVRFSRRHIAKFMLVARYMGSRAAVICSASIEPKRPKGKAWVDLKNGVFYGRPEGERETSKRKQTVQAPPELLLHLRRWRARGQRYVVEWNGEPVTSVKKGHAAAVRDAGFGAEVTQHTWRHSVATWLMQGGAPQDDIAEFLGMRQEILRKVYGHHRPENSASVHTAIRAHRQKLVKDKNADQAISNDGATR